MWAATPPPPPPPPTSYGLFKISLSPICFCGLPRNVKAIQLAAAEGQKIWTITQGSLDQALASIELSDDVETDIRNSVYAGKEVTAHERPVNFFGSQSSGYIVLDPYSGAGPYLIEGGENGGYLKQAGGGGVIAAAITALVFNGLPAAAAAAVTASLALLMVGAMLLLTAYVKLQQG